MNKHKGFIEIILIGGIFILSMVAADVVYDLKKSQEVQTQESTK